MEQSRPLKLGELLVQDQIISNRQLAWALSEQKRLNAESKRKFKIGEILLFSKYLSLVKLQAVLLKQKPRSREQAAHLQKLRQIQEDPLRHLLQGGKRSSTKPSKTPIFGGLSGWLKGKQA